MYSVEDLLISHGYKLPQHASSPSAPSPAPATASSSHQAHSSSSLPSYNKHHEILENRPGSRTLNGYERASGAQCENSAANPQAKVYTVGNNNNEPRERSQSRREGEIRGQTDTHSLGESLTSDSGYVVCETSHVRPLLIVE